MGAIELGKIPIIVFCTGRAMKGIPLGITTQALLKNICRSVCFDGSIESLGTGLTDPTNLRVEDAVCDSSGEFIPPTGQSRRSGFADQLSQPDSVEASPVFRRLWYR
jgi:hypothetical protein